MTSSNVPRVIAGFGRSGTTWVQDVIAQSNSLRAVFEPLHPDEMPGASAYALLALNADDKDDALYAWLNRFFFEPVHSRWADYRIPENWLRPRWSDLGSLTGIKTRLSRFNQVRAYLIKYSAQRKRPNRIVKFIRANMILSWLKTNFDARIVYIIRHPGAVVLSQSAKPKNWDPYKQIERYRASETLLEALDESARRLLHERLEHLEALTLCWCIENRIALAQARERNILVSYYELLLERGGSEWERILSALELDTMPDRNLIHRPSQQAHGDKARRAELVRSYDLWMKETDAKTCRRMQKILDATGMREYRLDQALPLTHS